MAHTCRQKAAGVSSAAVYMRSSTDCVRACLASYLGVPYDETPGVDYAAATFWADWTSWLAERGLETALFPWAPGFLDRWVAILGRDGPMTHFVVCSGTEVLHDPHPPEQRVAVRRSDVQAALVIGELGDDGWREAISAELRSAAAAGDPRVWRIERLLPSDWAVEMYRLRGDHDKADAMLARLNETE